MAGGEPVFPEVTALWPTVSLEELVRRQQDSMLRLEPEFAHDPVWEQGLEEELGTGWQQAVPETDVFRWREVVGAAAAQRDPYSIEYRLRRADGAYRLIPMGGRPGEGPLERLLDQLVTRMEAEAARIVSPQAR